MELPNEFIYYKDEAHGWLEVPTSAVLTLKRADKDFTVSRFSYMSRSFKYTYLEEDRDASLFLRCREKFTNAEPCFKTIRCKGQSKIRNLARFFDNDYAIRTVER